MGAFNIAPSIFTTETITTVSLCCADSTRKWFVGFGWRIWLTTIEHGRALLEKRKYALVRIRCSARGMNTDSFGRE